LTPDSPFDRAAIEPLPEIGTGTRARLLHREEKDRTARRSSDFCAMAPRTGTDG
jgi:hypothetical protein